MAGDWCHGRERHVTSDILFPSGELLTRPMNGLSIRAVSRHSRNFRLRSVRRHLHTAKPLPYPIEEGLGDFLPPAALKTIGVEYQEGLLERLSEQVHGAFECQYRLTYTSAYTGHKYIGTELANKSVVQTIIDTAPDRSKMLAFNYASQALNNSFFLDTLVRQPLFSVHHPWLNRVEETPSVKRVQ